MESRDAENNEEPCNNQTCKRSRPDHPNHIQVYMKDDQLGCQGEKNYPADQQNHELSKAMLL